MGGTAGGVSGAFTRMDVAGTGVFGAIVSGVTGLLQWIKEGKERKEAKKLAEAQAAQAQAYANYNNSVAPQREVNSLILLLGGAAMLIFLIFRRE